MEPADYIPALVQRLRGRSKVQQAAAARALSTMRNERQAVVAAGAIPALTQLLRESSTAAALHCLALPGGWAAEVAAAVPPDVLVQLMARRGPVAEWSGGLLELFSWAAAAASRRSMQPWPYATCAARADPPVQQLPRLEQRLCWRHACTPATMKLCSTQRLRCTECCSYIVHSRQLSMRLGQSRQLGAHWLLAAAQPFGRQCPSCLSAWRLQSKPALKRLPRLSPPQQHLCQQLPPPHPNDQPPLASAPPPAAALRTACTAVAAAAPCAIAARHAAVRTGKLTRPSAVACRRSGRRQMPMQHDAKQSLLCGPVLSRCVCYQRCDQCV